MAFYLSHRKSKPLRNLALVALVCCLSACRPYSATDDNWAATSGTVKNIQGISPQGTPATSKAKPLFNRVTFDYEFENKSYEGSESVGLNAPIHFEQGQTIPLKVNKQSPTQAKIDLPPEVPDKTGMTWRRGLHLETSSGD